MPDKRSLTAFLGLLTDFKRKLDLTVVAYRPLSFSREVRVTIQKKNPPARLRMQDGG